MNDLPELLGPIKIVNGDISIFACFIDPKFSIFKFLYSPYYLPHNLSNTYLII